MSGVGALQLRNGPVAFHHCYCDQNEAPASDRVTNTICLEPVTIEEIKILSCHLKMELPVMATFRLIY